MAERSLSWRNRESLLFQADAVWIRTDIDRLALIKNHSFLHTGSAIPNERLRRSDAAFCRGVYAAWRLDQPRTPIPRRASAASYQQPLTPKPASNQPATVVNSA